MRYLTLLTVLALVAACSIRAPELDASITDQSRAADWPELVPLGPILTRTELAGPPRAEAAGRSLEWRAADLRRRAAILRRMQVN